VPGMGIVIHQGPTIRAHVPDPGRRLPPWRRLRDRPDLRTRRRVAAQRARRRSGGGDDTGPDL